MRILYSDSVISTGCLIANAYLFLIFMPFDSEQMLNGFLFYIHYSQSDDKIKQELNLTITIFLKKCKNVFVYIILLSPFD